MSAGEGAPAPAAADGLASCVSVLINSDAVCRHVECVLISGALLGRRREFGRDAAGGVNRNTA